MSLYARDFITLTPEELAAWKSIKEEERTTEQGSERFPFRRNLFSSYPKAARHYLSLFPNNFLDPIDLKDNEYLQKQLDGFSDLLDSESVNELSILNFINRSKSYFIIGSILKKYFPFGHHEAHLFKEFPLGTSFEVDYLLLGKGSGGWNFVFVELEAPNGRITTKDGLFGEVFRKGLSQVKDWDIWLQKNFISLREFFDKSRSTTSNLPDEFINYEKTRMNFVVVAGRRKDFDDRTYYERRELMNSSVYVLHYDNLFDSSSEIIGQPPY